MPSHSNSFGNNAEKDTAGCRALNRKSIVIGGDGMGKLAVFDISESGRQIGEKLLAVLDTAQKKDLVQYVIEKGNQSGIDDSLVITPNHDPRENIEPALTQIHIGDLRFCLEHRLVSVRGQEIDLTAKEFDILALLIMNPKRVFTYEMIVDIVWSENYDYYSRKAVNNHISNLRKKLKIEPDIPDYIKSVHSIGYKFDG